MSDFSFKPVGGRFGVQPVVVRVGPIGPADYLGGAAPLTVNGTTIFRLGSPAAGRVSVFAGGAVSVTTVPADADGTIVGTFVKYVAATDATVTLTGNVNLEALVTREATAVTPLATLTDAQRTFQAGDTLEFHVVNNSAVIDTQPAGLWIAAEMLVQA